MGASEIILDPKIRDWVLIPLTIIMVFMGLGRHYAAKLMRKERRAEPEKVKDAMTLNRAKMLGMNCYFLPESAFATRMAYFNDSETGILRTRESEPVDPMKANRTYGFFTRLNTTTFKKTIAENPRLSSGQGAYEDPLTLLDDNIIDESDGTKPGAVFLPSSPALLDYICNSATLLSGELKRWSANKVRRCPSAVASHFPPDLCCRCSPSRGAG